MGNSFTSTKVAEDLLAKGTTIVGSMNRQRRELPPSARNQEAKKGSNTVMKSNNATLTIYQNRSDKNVCILSTMRPMVTDSKAKPESVTNYIKIKCGVDTLDRKVRKYHSSEKVWPFRWPFAVFYYMLHLAAINAEVLYKQCMGTDKKSTSLDFMMGLISQLRKDHVEGKPCSLPCNPAPQTHTPRRAKRGRPPGPVHTDAPSKKRRQCQLDRCSGNKTTEACHECYRRVCGPCRGACIVICYKCVAHTPGAGHTPHKRAKRGRPPGPVHTDAPSRKRRQCQLDRCGNKTKEVCHNCQRRVCGTCCGACIVTCYKCI